MSVITADIQNGFRTQSIVWHAHRDLQPDRTLCNRTLSKNFRRSKGIPSCLACRRLLTLEEFTWELRGALLTFAERGVLPHVASVWENDDLFTYDLIARRKNEYVLTGRGKTAVEDLTSPVGYLDPKTRLFHGRWSLESVTRCGISLNSGIGTCVLIEELRRQNKTTGRRTITCIACATARDPYADYSLEG